MRSTKPAVSFIFITLLLDVLGFGLLIPVGPSLVKSLLHGGAGGTDAEAAKYVGALMATFYAMSFLFAPLLGVLSDRYGRRRVILIALLGSGVDYFAMALAPSLAWLFVTRVINGISGASFSVVSAYVADVTPPEKRAGAFGMIGAAFGLGFVIGPLMGGLLGSIDLRLPFYVAGGLTICNWMYGYFVLPESLPPERRSPVALARCNPVGAYANLARYPLVLGLAASLFLLNMSQFILHATWALYTEHRYGWAKWEIGLSLFAVGFAG
ncbi:MAG TPA: MFS transporter, partial [Phycisphaerales bacterium]|nr:MFS transporter [Phycisphaerales bacterium]